MDKKSLARRKRDRALKLIKRNWLLYLFVLPTVVYYIMFQYVPMYGIQIAFQDYRIGQVIGQSKWVGLMHLKKFFDSIWFGTVMKNTLTISLLGMVVGFPLPIVLALLLNEIQNMKFRKFVQTVSYAPHFIATVVLCGMITMFLSPSTGVLGTAINEVRAFFGLDPVNYLTKGSAFKWIYILSDIWKGTGWGSVLYFATLSGVDPQLSEAAKVDGANKLQCIWHINIPVLVPTMIISLILKCGNILSVGQEKVYLLQNDTILLHSEVISTYVYRVGLMGGKYSFSTAVGLFNSVVNAVMLLTVNAIVRKLDKSLSLI